MMHFDFVESTEDELLDIGVWIKWLVQDNVMRSMGCDQQIESRSDVVGTAGDEKDGWDWDAKKR